MAGGYHNLNTDRSNGAHRTHGSTAVASHVKQVKMGQARMSLGSAAILLKLAALEAKWVQWKTLKTFVDAFRLTTRDVEPLVDKGWFEQREHATTRELSIRITDAGNAQVRGLVQWLDLQDEGGAA